MELGAQRTGPRARLRLARPDGQIGMQVLNALGDFKAGTAISFLTDFTPLTLRAMASAVAFSVAASRSPTA